MSYRALCGFLVACAFGGCGTRDEGAFPELKPDLPAPDGYKWQFHNGPDFYIWFLAEPNPEGKRGPSGIGIYFGLHPNPSATAGADGRAVGRTCGREVTWLIERNDDATDRWVRQDALFDYDHGRGFRPLRLHVWVWGPTEEATANLLKRVEELKFVQRP